MKKIYTIRKKGFLVLSVLGIQFIARHMRFNRELFSERIGITKYCQIGKWRLIINRKIVGQ